MKNDYDQMLERLVSLRQSLGVSQESVAEMLNLTQSQYSKLEHGKVMIPGMVLLGLWKMGWDVDYLMSGSRTKKELHPISEWSRRGSAWEKRQLMQLAGWMFAVLWPEKQARAEVRLLWNLLQPQPQTVLLAARKMMGLSQSAVSEQLGVCIRTYRKMERGLILPDACLLLRLQRLTRCRALLFLGTGEEVWNILDHLWAEAGEGSKRAMEQFLKAAWLLFGRVYLSDGGNVGAFLYQTPGGQEDAEGV